MKMTRGLARRFSLWLDKPEYVFRPSNLVERLRFGLARSANAQRKLPCGVLFTVNRHEAIGRSIAKTGTYELAVSEAIWRLLRHGDSAIDVGANIGYMTALMAARVGPGKIYAFEPCEDVLPILHANIASCGATFGAKVILVESAIADFSGEAELFIPEGFDGNRGIATLSNRSSASNSAQRVHVRTLDDSVGANESFRLLKIDVEGAELGVLKGATKILKERRIQNVIYEDHAQEASDVTKLLTASGYEVRRLSRTFAGPLLSPVGERLHRSDREPPAFVATLDPDPVWPLLRKKGWQVLQ